MEEMMDIRTDSFFTSRQVNMTPERQKVADVMILDEEGLAPRCFAVLLLIHDGQQLSAADLKWVADEVRWERVSGYQDDIFTMRDGVPGLTAKGAQIAQAADRGDADTIYRLTTRPDWGEAK
jgi:hypothetical protein